MSALYDSPSLFNIEPPSQQKIIGRPKSLKQQLLNHKVKSNDKENQRNCMKCRVSFEVSVFIVTITKDREILRLLHTHTNKLNETRDLCF